MEEVGACLFWTELLSEVIEKRIFQISDIQEVSLSISHGAWLSDVEHAHIHLTCGGHGAFESVLHTLESNANRPLSEIEDKQETLYEDDVALLGEVKVDATVFFVILKKARECFEQLDGYSLGLLIPSESEACKITIRTSKVKDDQMKDAFKTRFDRMKDDFVTRL